MAGAETERCLVTALTAREIRSHPQDWELPSLGCILWATAPGMPGGNLACARATPRPREEAGSVCPPLWAVGPEGGWGPSALDP